MQYSVFDRKRQAHLLKVMNWCSDNFVNFMDDRAWSKQELDRIILQYSQS